MKLSEIQVTALYPAIVPSNKKKVTIRPFVVKEERALLLAQESEDQSVMLATLAQIVTNCCEPKEAVKDLTTFDLEYLFTTIRAKSVGEFSEIILRCDDCKDEKAKARVLLDLRTVEVHNNPEHKSLVKLSDTVSLTLRYPSLAQLAEIAGEKDEGKAKNLAVAASIEKVIVGDDVMRMDEERNEEIMAFVEKLTSKQVALIDKFFDTMPDVRIKVKYKCPVCSKDHDRFVKGINSFF